MKKYLFLFLMMCCAFESHAIEPKGKYISQSGELLFRFVADSLYSKKTRSTCWNTLARTKTETTTPTNATTSSL